MPKAPKEAQPVPTISIGIDPGKSGGIVALLDYGDRVDSVLHPMPETELDVIRAVAFWTAYEGPRFAVVEWIHPAIKGIGKSQMSKLYGNYMQLRAACLMAEIPFETAQAVKWQRSLGITPRKKTEGRSQWKNRLKAKAQELFPKTQGITLHTADALLIAEYCRRLRLGEHNAQKS